MSFLLGGHGKMIEMFGKCPNCHVSLLIEYEDGATLCTHCGYHNSVTRVRDG